MVARLGLENSTSGWRCEATASNRFSPTARIYAATILLAAADIGILLSGWTPVASLRNAIRIGKYGQKWYYVPPMKTARVFNAVRKRCFVVDKAFHAVVESDFLKLVSKKPFIASTKMESERDFISELDAHKNLLNLDQVKLSPAGAPGANLEPCDFFSTARQSIHLKDGHSSAPISHLWNQGVVSAETFVRDEKFRIDLRKEVKKRQTKSKKVGFDALLPDGRSRPVPSEYTVVFGIMRDRYKKSGTVSLPFFSKVSLRSVADRIQLMGFPVEVHLVEKV
jgi:Family of unknown function (DUF6119)